MSGLLTMQLHSVLQQEEYVSARGDGKAFLEVNSLLSRSARKHISEEQLTVVHMHMLLCRS